MTRGVRAVLLPVLFALTATSVTGCGATRSLLGIHGAPAPKAVSVPLTVDQTTTIITRDFTAAYQGIKLTGAAAAAAQRTAYAGSALRAVHARDKLAGITPTVPESPLLEPGQPLLLAVSRGFGFPRFIVAQSAAPAAGRPILHLLTSADAMTPYRIGFSAEMMPLVKVKPFDPPGQGSPLARDGTGLSVAPAALLSSYAASMAFPAKPLTRLPATRLPFSADSFSTQVRASATGVAKALATQASFSQVHTVVPGSTYAVRQASGDVLVFGVIERKDSFSVKSGQAVNTVANKAFVALTGKKRVTRRASITTLEFLAFAVPRSPGQATLVAAREQVVAGSGS